MFPILGIVFGYTVYSYSFFIAVGYFGSLALAYCLSRIRDRDFGPFLDLGLISIIFGILGGRILFVLTNLYYFKRFPLEAFYFWSGGLVFYGGLLLAVPISFLYIRWKRLPLGETMDIMAMALCFGHAIGRIGCLGAGCCHGSETNMPWAIRIDNDLVDPSLRGLPIHPTQAYEAILLFVLTLVLVSLFKKQKFFPGGISLIYIMTYAVLRITLEVFRGDQIRGFLYSGFSTSQFLGCLFLLLGYIIWRRGQNRPLWRNH